MGKCVLRYDVGDTIFIPFEVKEASKNGNGEIYHVKCSSGHSFQSDGWTYVSGEFLEKTTSQNLSEPNKKLKGCEICKHYWELETDVGIVSYCNQERCSRRYQDMWEEKA